MPSLRYHSGHLPAPRDELTDELPLHKFALVQTNVNSWTALGDPTRRTIFELLVEHPCSVGELARALPVTRPAVSQHLKVLREAGLVANTRLGKQRIYRVDPEGLARLRAELDRFWGKTLAAYKVAAEQSSEEQE